MHIVNINVNIALYSFPPHLLPSGIKTKMKFCLPSEKHIVSFIFILSQFNTKYPIIMR